MNKNFSGDLKSSALQHFVDNLLNVTVEKSTFS